MIPAQPYPNTCPSWMREDPVRAVPTQAEIDDAHQGKLDAWLAYILADKADQDDRWADYQCAIEQHNTLQHQRNQALLKEAAICPI